MFSREDLEERFQKTKEAVATEIARMRGIHGAELKEEWVEWWEPLEWEYIDQWTDRVTRVLPVW